MVKYFMASLTVPEEEMWVNLSPYEEDRIVPQGFGDTEMGRDLLAQDYILKQLTASLMYPEDDLGKAFWERVYQKAQEKYGTTDIPLNTFNKIWIVPDRAEVHQYGASAFVVDSRLDVMLEEDYVALQKNLGKEKYGLDSLDQSDAQALSAVSSEVVREVLIPEIRKEVNEGKNFADLRQIYNAMILGTWYKLNLKESLLGQVYVDKNKTLGVDIEDKEVNQKIYNQYVDAFKKGVYDYIKEDYDPATQQIIPRKYFSGGYSPENPDKGMLSKFLTTKTFSAMALTGIMGLMTIAGSIFTITVDAKEALKEETFKPIETPSAKVDEEMNLRYQARDAVHNAKIDWQVAGKLTMGIFKKMSFTEIDLNNLNTLLDRLEIEYRLQSNYGDEALIKLINDQLRNNKVNSETQIAFEVLAKRVKKTGWDGRKKIKAFITYALNSKKNQEIEWVLDRLMLFPKNADITKVLIGLSKSEATTWYQKVAIIRAFLKYGMSEGEIGKVLVWNKNNAVNAQELINEAKLFPNDNAQLAEVEELDLSNEQVVLPIKEAPKDVESIINKFNETNHPLTLVIKTGMPGNGRIDHTITTDKNEVTVVYNPNPLVSVLLYELLAEIKNIEEELDLAVLANFIDEFLAILDKQNDKTFYNKFYKERSRLRNMGELLRYVEDFYIPRRFFLLEDDMKEFKKRIEGELITRLSDITSFADKAMLSGLQAAEFITKKLGELPIEINDKKYVFVPTKEFEDSIRDAQDAAVQGMIQGSFLLKDLESNEKVHASRGAMLFFVDGNKVDFVASDLHFSFSPPLSTNAEWIVVDALRVLENLILDKEVAGVIKDVEKLKETVKSLPLERSPGHAITFEFNGKEVPHDQALMTLGKAKVEFQRMLNNAPVILKGDIEKMKNDIATPYGQKVSFKDLVAVANHSGLGSLITNVIQGLEEIEDTSKREPVKNLIENLRKLDESMYTSAGNDKASLVQPKYGGINLDPAMMRLQIRRDDKGIPLPLAQQPLKDMRIDGFVPVIINITPLVPTPVSVAPLSFLRDIPGESRADRLVAL
ncbi:MAG: hypothetical protein A2Y04_03550 [Omnitrophica WOR_2 bacterium GWC2_45_7]|nr:MAG: hypothetical protein A2Y04_03550 [Omnitrophica WOR_2 bacterium GWC2_45_7]